MANNYNLEFVNKSGEIGQFQDEADTFSHFMRKFFQHFVLIGIQYAEKDIIRMEKVN